MVNFNLIEIDSIIWKRKIQLSHFDLVNGLWFLLKLIISKATFQTIHLNILKVISLRVNFNLIEIALIIWKRKIKLSHFDLANGLCFLLKLTLS